MQRNNDRTFSIEKRQTISHYVFKSQWLISTTEYVKRDSIVQKLLGGDVKGAIPTLIYVKELKNITTVSKLKSN